MSGTLSLLQPPDSLLYPNAGIIWVPSRTYAGDGEQETVVWTAGDPVIFYLETSPSTYGLQDFILSEEDMIFTLDVGHFKAGQVVAPSGVLQLTVGAADLVGGWWQIRGDKQPVHWIAGKNKHLMSRIPTPPTGAG